MLSSVFLFFSFATAALSLPYYDSHEHSTPRSLPANWFQKRSHPAHNLFARAGTDGVDYPDVGSPEWRSAYPNIPLDPNAVPQAWKDALKRAVDAGKIPDIPQSTNTPQTNPTYPTGFDPNGPQVCSSTYKCRNPDDIWDAPDGFFGTGFDDGPQPITDTLVKFLEDHNETATHFLIGVNIRDYPEQFKTILNAGGDLAVHTYTHPYMTTLSNLEVVAQLGWTMQMIHDSAGGRVPRFWRPPYGDSDNRVRAIGLEVFGIEQILWNQDTADWSLTTGGTSLKAINSSMTSWLTGPKSPGLIVLEHELSEGSVQAFIDAYPVIKANGWQMASVTEFADGDSAYQNADSTDSDTVEEQDIVFESDAASASSSAPSSAGTSQVSVSAILSSAITTPSSSSSNSGTSESSGNGAHPFTQAWSLSRTLGSLLIAFTISAIL